MITITDGAGRVLTIDDAELTCAEVQSRIDDFRDEQRHVPEFTISIAHICPPVPPFCDHSGEFGAMTCDVCNPTDPTPPAPHRQP